MPRPRSKSSHPHKPVDKFLTFYCCVLCLFAFCSFDNTYLRGGKLSPSSASGVMSCSLVWLIFFDGYVNPKSRVKWCPDKIGTRHLPCQTRHTVPHILFESLVHCLLSPLVVSSSSSSLYVHPTSRSVSSVPRRSYVRNLVYLWLSSESLTCRLLVVENEHIVSRFM